MQPNGQRQSRGGRRERRACERGLRGGAARGHGAFQRKQRATPLLHKTCQYGEPTPVTELDRLSRAACCDLLGRIILNLPIRSSVLDMSIGVKRPTMDWAVQEHSGHPISQFIRAAIELITDV